MKKAKLFVIAYSVMILGVLLFIRHITKRTDYLIVFAYENGQGNIVLGIRDSLNADSIYGLRKYTAEHFKKGVDDFVILNIIKLR